MTQILNGPAAILLYHGVTDSPSVGIENFSGKHITAKRFDAQMEWLSLHAAPMTLREMAVRLSRGDILPKNSVAVSFDDTFVNNRTVALPILQKHHVPATFFVTTGFVGTDRMFWVDRVEHCLNVLDQNEMRLDLPGFGLRRYSLATQQERVYAVTDIKRAMKAMGRRDREVTLGALEALVPAAYQSADTPNYRMMSWDDVRGLDLPPDYEVGGHTVNHEILSYLVPEELEYEVKSCLAALHDATGRTIDLFSYPEGQPEHFNDRVIKVLKEAGVTICPTAIAGVNVGKCDPFHLKRIMVGFMGEPFPFADSL